MPQTLEQQLATAKLTIARLQGFDRMGNGVRIGTGWACNCQWGSRVHGDECPEHGVLGIPIPKGDT